MPVPLVLPDACVLYSKTLRDWLLIGKLVSGGSLFRLAWTEDILAETIYCVRRNNPHLTGGQISQIRSEEIGATMDVQIEDYPSGQDATMIADVFDRHVHAAAVRGGVKYLITTDTGFTGLTSEQRDELEYEIYTPDEFFVVLDDSSPRIVKDVLAFQLAHYARRPGTHLDFAERLEASGCPEFASRVKVRCQQLARQA